MSHIDEIRCQFLDHMSDIAQAEHMQPISGRIYGLLVFDGGPIAFGELARRLNVSRASISNAARQLEGHGLIRRLKRPGERGDFFDLEEPPYGALIAGILRRACHAEKGISKAVDALSPADAARADRLLRFKTFYTALQSCASLALDQMTGDPRA